MMLAAKLYAGYLATHPGWLITITCVCLAFLFVVAFYSFTADEHMASYREYSPAELDAFAADWRAAIHRQRPQTVPGRPPLFPAADGEGPGPVEDGAAEVPRAAAVTPGPGTRRNGPPWEQAPPVADTHHAPGVWGADAYHQATTASIGGR